MNWIFDFHDVESRNVINLVELCVCRPSSLHNCSETAHGPMGKFDELNIEYFWLLSSSEKKHQKQKDNMSAAAARRWNREK